MRLTDSMLQGRTHAYLQEVFSAKVPAVAAFLTAAQIEKANAALPFALTPAPDPKRGASLPSESAAPEDSKQVFGPTKSRYSLRQFSVLTGNLATFIYCMQKMLLLANAMTCPRCTAPCSLKLRLKGRLEHFSWTCSCNSRNKFTRSVFANSAFANCPNPQDRVAFAYLHLYNVPANSIRDMLGLGKNRFRAYKVWLQDVVGNMNQHINVKLGGKGKAGVEIDATYTGGKHSMKKGWGGNVHRGALRYKKHGLIVVM
jgi:hypothetical protein